MDKNAVSKKSMTGLDGNIVHIRALVNCFKRYNFSRTFAAEYYISDLQFTRASPAIGKRQRMSMPVPATTLPTQAGLLWGGTSGAIPQCGFLNGKPGTRNHKPATARYAPLNSCGLGKSAMVFRPKCSRK